MTASEPETLTLNIPVTFRIADKSDVHKLEWYGQFTHFRNLIKRAYREQQRGRRIMLLADFNDFPIGQVFIQLASSNSLIADGNSRAYLYSFRVMSLFQGQGIGTRLLHEAESILTEHGFKTTTLSVAKENAGALRLYQRNGYQIFGEDAGKWSYVNHKGVTCYVEEPCWILKKGLG